MTQLGKGNRIKLNEEREKEAVSNIAKNGLVSYEVMQSGIGDIEVIDITGRVVLKETEKIKKGKNQIRVSTEGISSGIYFYRLRKEGTETMSGKITVIK
ncbi:MAG: T9SS type A sorting domain-containing protein [bacterium]